MTVKRSFSFVLDKSVFIFREEGHGAADGSGFFTFDEADVEWHPHDEKEGHYLLVEICRDDLIELRDFLIARLPIEATSAES